MRFLASLSFITLAGVAYSLVAQREAVDSGKKDKLLGPATDTSRTTPSAESGLPESVDAFKGVNTKLFNRDACTDPNSASCSTVHPAATDGRIVRVVRRDACTDPNSASCSTVHSALPEGRREATPVVNHDAACMDPNSATSCSVIDPASPTTHRSAPLLDRDACTDPNSASCSTVTNSEVRRRPTRLREGDRCVGCDINDL